MTASVLVLWAGDSGWAERDLLGQPLWCRALDAASAVRAGRVLWTGPRPPSESHIEPLPKSELAKLRGDVVFLSAEAPFLAAGTLKRLSRKLGERARTVTGPRGETRPTALAATGAQLQRMVAGRQPSTFDGLVALLRPEPVLPEDEEELLRVDSAEAWTRAAGLLRKAKLAALVRRGVVVTHPESVLVDPDVRVGAGTVLHPWVHLEGTTRVGRNCVIGSFSHIVDSTLGADTVLLDHCFVRSSRIGRRVQLGPFAHLRPASEVGDAARVGNFVELKKTRLLDGAKAPHLTYLGDAVIGKDANVGAGTITCNYDGVRKHQTVVGDGAFIGSDVQLVAPVRVGKGAYVAAGSCIVEDVPAHALALARSRQIVKRGWAKKKQGKSGRSRS